MRKLVVGVLILALVFLVLSRLNRSSSEKEESAMVEQRELTPAELLALSEETSHSVRLRTVRDVLPGGLAAAMVPMVVNWQESQLEGPDSYAVLHNVNYGGNPAEGTTVLHRVRVPLEGVASAEFTLVPLGLLGKHGMVHHGQLRFVFHRDKPLVLLDARLEAAGNDPYLYDLVLSWEAWRAPGAGYDVMTGMDPRQYKLSARMYAGPQRFLEDALGKRDWYSFPLAMPGGARGLAELLKVSLALSDGIARHTLSRLLQQAEGAWLEHAPAMGDDQEAVRQQWREIRGRVEPQEVTDDPRINLPEEEQSYQTLLRSCASLAYYSIEVAVDRLVAAGLAEDFDRQKLVQLDIGSQEPWMEEIAEANLVGIFLRAPHALSYLRRNPASLPRKIPDLLDTAGLLQHQDGKRIEVHYSLGGTTPYGRLESNLIR